MLWIIIGIWLVVLIFLLMIVRSAAHSVDDSMQAMIDEEQSRYIDQYFKGRSPLLPQTTESADQASATLDVGEKRFIVIEGLDGSGKATQAKLLASYLQEAGKSVKQISFPDYESESSALVKMYLNGEFGDKPGDVNAYAASAFYAVDRYASWKKNWSHDLENGFVIADRYTTSNAIHQCSKLDAKGWDSFLSWLFDFEYNKLSIPSPDLVVYLRVDPVVSQQLLASRYHGDLQKEDIHEKDREYLARCQKAADYCASHLGWKIVDCCENGEMRSIEDIHKDIMDVIGI